MHDILEKYTNSVIQNINKNNFEKIILFLKNNDCNYVEDFISDYLDIFTIEYTEFVRKFDILNEKYNGTFLDKVNENMNLLEEFFII